MYADSSRMWAKYHSMRDGYREGAERVAAAAAARLDKVCCPASCTARPDPPRAGDCRVEWVAQTTERVLARWRAGHLGPMTDSA